jgi:hypothetical protein
MIVSAPAQDHNDIYFAKATILRCQEPVRDAAEGRAAG